MIKELEDYNWFPEIFRRFQVEYIGSIILWSRFYQPLVPVMKELMNTNNMYTIHDLCSGSGMPAMYMQEQLNGNYKTILSDKFPEICFKNTATVKYLQEKTDLLDILLQQDICYSIYNAFHHFTDLEKQQLIQKFKQANVPFMIAEILEPDLFTLLKIFFTTTLIQIITVPFVKPFSLLRLLFTYLIPVNVFTITYDGIISVLKSRSVRQCRALIKGMENDSYKITVDRYSSWKGAVICIKGDPKK